MELKIFTDGGSRGNPGNAGIGIIVYKTEDNVSFNQIKTSKIIYKHSNFIGVATNNEAEYTALLEALDWLSKNNHQNQVVTFYLDSKLVVEQINKNWKIKDDRMKIFANRAWNILDKFDYKVNFVHIKRDKNKEADSLVNQALDANQL